jgi:hypothetical protein
LPRAGDSFWGRFKGGSQFNHDEGRYYLDWAKSMLKKFTTKARKAHEGGTK